MDILAAINDTNATVFGSVMVVDMVGSSQLKESNSEPAWLAIYARAFDTITKQIPDFAEIVKFLGDGIAIVFPDEKATDAINCAIKIQESIDTLRNIEGFPCQFSIGISTGRFKKIRVVDQKYDYLGSVVDKAFRLCSAANAKAIFVDGDTIGAANVNRITSSAGRAEDPPRAKYVATENHIPLKGFKAAVPVHEILWRDSFGLKIAYASDLKTSSSKQEPTIPSLQGNAIQLPSSASVKSEISRGIFDKWISDDNGFIVGDSAERFFTSKKLIVGDSNLKKGDVVYFVPVSDTGKSRKATGVIKIGEELTGVVVKKRSGDKYVFIRCTELFGFGFPNIYTPLNGITLEEGDKVIFDIGESWNSKLNSYKLLADNVAELEE